MPPLSSGSLQKIKSGLRGAVSTPGCSGIPGQQQTVMGCFSSPSRKKKKKKGPHSRLLCPGPRSVTLTGATQGCFQKHTLTMPFSQPHASTRAGGFHA